jgi:hypothetical protein
VWCGVVWWCVSVCLSPQAYLFEKLYSFFFLKKKKKPTPSIEENKKDLVSLFSFEPFILYRSHIFCNKKEKTLSPDYYEEIRVGV